MDDLLTPVSTTYLKPRNEPEPLFREVKTASSQEEPRKPSAISTHDDAVDALKNQPDYDSLISVLQFLSSHRTASDGFSFSAPSPKNASIIHLLVTEIAPNYWTLLLEGAVDDATHHNTTLPSDADLFICCLRSLTGLNAVITQTRALIQEARLGGKEERRTDLSLNLGILLSVLSSILGTDGSIPAIWSESTRSIANAALQRVQSQKLSSILTNGQIVSTSAEALEIIGRDKIRDDTQWVGDGLRYSTWMGNAIAAWVISSPEADAMSFSSELFQRALSLHHSENLIKIVIDRLLLSPQSSVSTFTQLALSQPRTSKKIIHFLLRHLSQKHLQGLSLDDTSPNDKVSAVAQLLKELALNDATRREVLINWCASSSGAGLGDGIGIRRAVVAALAQDRDAIIAVLEKSLAQFGDELYIKHSAILQQDAQFLGLVVGETLSALVDDNKKRLDFKMEQTETEEAKHLKDLTKVSDPIGSIDPILSNLETETMPQKRKLVTPNKTIQKKTKQKKKPIATESKPKAIIEEVDSSDDDEDLAPYSKDSDPEDSDDDATLVQRNKPKPPVYIRDLVSYLRDSESYDKQLLALQTAPVLIRRKTNYGTEVSFHADELAGLLVGIQDKFEVENFQDLRLQGMVALVVSQPKTMAPWFARTFFEGDYSLHQRTSVLITLGLSARELAGFEASEYQSAASFPSKRLPEKMEQLYLSSTNDNRALPFSQLKSLPSNALDTISQSLTSSFLAPLAAEAADSNTGPDVLKLQTFTARYKSKTKSKPRVRAIPNTTAALLATSFFSPLTAHFQVALRSAKPIILNHALLALYLQTLGIVIHSAGPSTLSLPQLTAELWNLLLGVRVHVLGDLGAMKGWLVAMASLLEVNGGDMRRLCENQGREVMETREWVAMVFEKTRGEDGGEENEVKMLSAGVLIRIGEAIEKYQALLMGDMIGFQ
ncbi:telomere length regulation protein-domain-containing protein [Fusarium acuminatum]|uniref:Telomere length regulation protein-domain-containing protein n=1 Tax=Fusarium acuminatum TaxID=5515 RepID=A0ABZ2WHK5_9HYPO